MLRTGLTLVLLSAFSSAPVLAQELNAISKVEVSGDATKVVVVVTGSRRPTFQAYQQKAPVRVVVDLVKSQLQNVPATVSPASEGILKEVRTTQMGAAGRELARLEIVFNDDVDYQMDADGNALRLTATRRINPAVAAAEKAAAEKAAAEKIAAEKAAAEKLALEKAAAEKAAAEKLAMEKAAAAEKLALEKAAAERAAADKLAMEKAAEKAAADKLEIARLEKEKTEKAAQEKAAILEIARLEKEKAEKQRIEREATDRAAAAARASELARLEKEKAEQETAAKTAQIARLEKERADRDAAARSSEQQRVDRERQVEKEKLARQDKAEQERLEKIRAEVARAETAKREQQSVAAAPAAGSERHGSAADAPSTREGDDTFGGKPAASKPAPVASHAAASEGSREAEGESGGGPRVLTFVGFKNVGEQSVIVVRTNDKVAFNVRKVGQNKIVLELENCRILLRNNQRILDTSYFPRTAIKMITPEEHEGAGKTVRILVELSEEVPYESKQENNTVSVLFQRPAG